MFRATVFDTETPGFNQNGIMQLGAVVLDHNFEVVSTFATLIQPEFYGEVEAGAFSAHGITKERCQDYGIPLKNALAILKNFMDISDVVVAHNYAYDSRVTAKCLELLNKENFLSRRRTFCTMNALTDVCRLPGKHGKYKWPKLQEAHQFMFGQGFEGAHDAMADVMATVRLLRGIKDKYPELLNRV